MKPERRPMDRSLKRKLVAGTVAALAVGGAGAGIAATQLGSSPNEESQAIVNDAAKQLGLQPDQLSGALKKAIENQIDAAVAAATSAAAPAPASVSTQRPQHDQDRGSPPSRSRRQADRSRGGRGGLPRDPPSRPRHASRACGDPVPP